ncbi:hypothetical protein ON010_g5264 [Phytophthora cinnamomi]|nr:hypothetical protein ON010_g5264 [Phytophthora cinnamomi]
MAFIEGYREGKELELEREDALLITFAKQAAEDHKDLIENQLKKIMDQQREKQRQEREEAAAKAAADKAGRSESAEKPVEEDDGSTNANSEAVDGSTNTAATDDKPTTTGPDTKQR